MKPFGLINQVLQAANTLVKTAAISAETQKKSARLS